MTENGSALSGDWDFDPAHTRIGFSARHAMVTTVRGSFNDVTGVPMTYSWQGRQYLIVPIGFPGHPGEFLALTLDRS